MRTKHNILGLSIGFFVISAGLALTLFRHWEPSGETWGYWLFARIFAESGRFIILDRSPLYILYLNMFRWLGYPLAVIVEYLVTSLILAVSLIVLLKRYSGLFLAVFAVILWLPFFQVADPPVQKLALALSCLAVAARSSTKANRFKLAVSYALLGCAYMLRSTYIIFIAVFAIWDIVKLLRQNNLKRTLSLLCPRKSDWPVLIVLVLAAWFIAMQSPHRWNNAWFSTTRWIPVKSGSMANDAFIQFSNWQYVYDKYGTFKDKDFYFTNQEVFNGADSMIGAIAANPRFVALQIARNIKRFFCLAASLTMLPLIFYKKLPNLEYLHYLMFFLFTVPFVLAVFYGAFRSSKSKNMALFLIGNALLAGFTIIFLPRARYMYPLVPIFILSACWYGKKISLKSSKIIGKLAIIFFMIIFSSGLIGWKGIAKDILSDIENKEIKVMERRPDSFKATFKAIELLIYNCRGLLSLEHDFVGAFMDIPLAKVYDFLEIPPFGQLNNSDYQGLYPERVDCLLISRELSEGVGLGTNHQIRYENYIGPYAEYLEGSGATVHKIQGFGEVVKLGGAI